MVKMGTQEKILDYLSVYGKENKYKIARALKTDVAKVTNALDLLREEGNIEIKEGNAILVKGKKPITIPKKPKIQPTEEVEEKPEEVTEEIPEEEKEEEFEEKEAEIPEHFGVKEEERIEGSVKFFNPKKGFGFITGDNGKDYYVNESSLKEGVTIKADDRVSFKAVQEAQGPKAEEVKKIGQSVEE